MTGLNDYGKSIASIIIYLIIFVSIIIILDEIINLTKFCYKYTYLYHYGKQNDNICKLDDTTSILEYEKSRFRIFSIINNYKLTKDLFNKNWINYFTYLIIIILTLVMFIAFGTLFYFFFIDKNELCTTNEASKLSFLKQLIKCLFSDELATLIPNCTSNYFVVFTLIIIFPIMYLFKGFFKVDYTYSGGYWTKIFHYIFGFILSYYAYSLFNKENDSEKYSKLFIYISFIIIFYYVQYIFSKIFDDYNNPIKIGKIYNNEDDADDTVFFDIYKQQEPTKPIKASILNDEKTKDLLTSFKYYTKEELEKKEPSEKATYSNDLKTINSYYREKKEYDENNKIYNYKYNIYKNNVIEFPELISIYTHLLPKLLGLDKSFIRNILFIIVFFIIIYIIFKYYNINFTDYYYHTIFMYLIAIASIIILNNAILTYNTYFNKFIIYEPITKYKFDMEKINSIFNLSIKESNEDYKNIIEYYNILTEYQKKLNISATTDTTSTTLIYDTNFIDKILNNEIIPDTDLQTGKYSILSSVLFNAVDDFKIEYNKLFYIRNAVHISLFSSLLNKNYITNNEIVFFIDSSKFYKKYSINNVNDYYYISLNHIETSETQFNKFNTFALLDTSTITKEKSATITNDIHTFFEIIKGTAVNNINMIDDKINQIRNNIKYLIYKNEKITNDYIKNNVANFYNNILQKDVSGQDLNSLIDEDNDIINNYKKQLVYINIILDYYAHFLKDVRNLYIKFFNTSLIKCDTADTINFKLKLKEYIESYLIKLRNNNYIFNTKNKKIEIYKQILKNTMQEFNNIFRKYFNIIKYIAFVGIKSNDNIDETAKKIINEIINNYNIYNTGNERYNDINKLIIRTLKIPTDYLNKYNHLNLKNKKELELNINNISWSFIIIVIIFAIILIEPTII